MSDLKTAILDAKYIDMIELGDFVVRDCGLPDVDSDGNLMPQATEIAAALFRWAADVQAAETRAAASKPSGTDTARDETGAAGFDEHDADGDPLMDADEAARLAAEAEGAPQPQGSD